MFLQTICTVIKGHGISIKCGTFLFLRQNEEIEGEKLVGERGHKYIERKWTGIHTEGRRS